MTIFSLLALVALALTAAGLYGVLTFSVQQRRREIGVRMALGAGTGSVTSLVVSQGLRLAGAGLVLGVVGALFVYRLLDTLLFGVSAGDAGAYTVGIVTLSLVALAASYLPARRACLTDPAVVLRED